MFSFKLTMEKLWYYDFCLIVWVFSSHLRIYSYGYVTIAGEGLQILTCAWHAWQWSSEGSLVCHNYCDTGHPFIMVISEDPWYSHPSLSVKQWSCHCLFDDFGVSRLGFEHPTFRLRGERSSALCQRRGLNYREN